METIVKSKKNKPVVKNTGPYNSVEELSLAKNGELIAAIKRLNLKVVVNKEH